MTDQQQSSTEELLAAIRVEMERQTHHLSKIRTSVGFLALVTAVAIVISLAALAGS